MLSNLFIRVPLVLFALANGANAASRKSGSTVEVDNIYYYVPPVSVSQLALGPEQLKSAAVSGEDLIPLTVMTTNFTSFDQSALKTLIESYAAVDDVFSPGFLQAIYLKSTMPAELTTSLSETLAEYNNKAFIISSAKDDGLSTACTVDIPSGPYFMSAYTGQLFQAYRLYSDFEGAFTEGVIATEGGNYSVMSAAIQGVQSSAIGVPSRLYYTKTEAQPLAGVRLGVKDIFNLAGTKRGCGSRAYYDLYPARNTTALVVQKLIDAGAIIVGKMKTSQFANGEKATADWVDYHSPFNARGDGYSDPSSSSAGAGAGIGAYSWLDLALGSDTGGSVRNPAQVNGAYGNRPTHNLVALTDAMPLSPLLDTAGLITRDAEIWKVAGNVIYDNLTTFTSFPKKLYTTGFPPNASNDAEEVLLSFLAKLETFLDVKSSVLDYDSIWAKSPQAEAANASTLSDLLSLTYPTLISKQQYNIFGKPFIADYGAANDGRMPFLDPNPMVRWAFGKSNQTMLEQGIANKTIFMDWWNGEVVKPDANTCSESLLLYPGTLATPNYRNEYLEPPNIPSGWGVYNIAIFAEVPDMVLPLGQAAYNSTITLHEEFLPVAVDILAAKGCDGMIFELAEQLQKAGITRVPKTGSTMYR